jgi:hypothetical protein
MDDKIKTEEQMTPEELKTLTDSEEFIVNFKEEDYEDPDKVEELRKRLQDSKTTIHQKRHYRDKVKELDIKVKELGDSKPPEKKPENKPSDKEGKDKGETENIVDPYKALEFRQDHPELSKEAAKEVLDYAGAKKISPEEALKKPVIQQYIKSLNDKEDIEGAQIPPKNKGASGAEKKDWSTASQAEIEAHRNKVSRGA